MAPPQTRTAEPAARSRTAEPAEPAAASRTAEQRPGYLAFWREHHLCTLTTHRADGTPHVVPVGVTYDPQARLARVITGTGSRKAAHVRAAGPGGAPVAVCQVERARWATLEGRATVSEDPERIAEAVRRYAERYGRTPRPDPDRVVIEIAVTRTMGNA